MKQENEKGTMKPTYNQLTYLYGEIDKRCFNDGPPPDLYGQPWIVWNARRLIGFFKYIESLPPINLDNIDTELAIENLKDFMEFHKIYSMKRIKSYKYDYFSAIFNIEGVNWLIQQQTGNCENVTQL